MTIKFEAILKSEVFSKKIVKFAVVARLNGKIEYITSGWKLKTADIQQCITSWQKHEPAVTLDGIKYSCLRNEPNFFSGLNYKNKSYLVGASSPEIDDQYFVLGFAPPKSNGGNAYVDIVRAANKMKKSGSYMDDTVELGKYAKEDIPKDEKEKQKNKEKKDKSKKEKIKKDVEKKQEKEPEPIITEKISEPIVLDNNSSVAQKAAFIANALANRGTARSFSSNYSSSNQTTPSSLSNVSQEPISVVDPKITQAINEFLQWIKNPTGLAGYIQYYLDRNDSRIIHALSDAYQKLIRVFGF